MEAGCRHFCVFDFLSLTWAKRQKVEILTRESEKAKKCLKTQNSGKLKLITKSIIQYTGKLIKPEPKSGQVLCSEYMKN